MSTEIDNRVVSIQFDNARFEKNVHQSIATLAALDESLQFQDSAKGIQNVSKEIEHLDMTHIQRGIDGVIEKFSALEIVAKTTIANITLKIENAVSRWTKSLTTDMMSSGYSKYDQQTSAMQTLVNSTGKSVEELEQKLGKLQWFSDETSYSFTEMMTALQTMSSSGGDLDKSIDLMMGLANATAFAGKNASAFVIGSRNLTQSYSMGYLTTLDWKSLETAGINSKALIETLIEAGEESGTIKRGEVSVASFRESLSKKWATTAVMEKAFGRFAEMSNKAYEMVQDETNGIELAKDAYALLGEEYDSIYLKAARAAQEAKTFSEAVDGTKDALATTWSETYTQIFGNYEEAKALWSELAEILYEAFVTPRQEVNAILKEWKQNEGRIYLIEAISAAFANLSRILETVKGAIRDVFPRKSGEELASMTKNIAEITAKLALSDKALIAIRVTISSVLSIIKSLGSSIMKLLHALLPATSAIKSISDLLLDVALVIGFLLSKVAELISSGTIVSTVAIGLQAVIGVIAAIVTSLVAAISALIEKVRSINFKPFTKALDIVRTIISAIGIAVGAIVIGVEYLIDRVKSLFLILKNSGFMSTIGNGLLLVVYGIKIGFEKLVSVITSAAQAVKAFVISFKDLSFGESLAKIANSFATLKNKLLAMFSKKDSNGDMFEESSEGGSTFYDVLQRIVTKLDEIRQRFTLGQIAALAFSVAIIGTAGSVSKLLSNTSSLVSNASSLLKVFRNVIAKTSAKTAGIFNIAKTVAVLAASLYLIASVPKEDLWEAIKIIGALLGITALFAATMIGLSKINIILGDGVKGMMLSIGALGGGLIAMAGALKILSTISYDEFDTMFANLMACVLAVVGIAMAATLINLTPAVTKGTQFIKISVLIAALSLSLKNVASSLQAISSVDTSAIEHAEAVLIPMLIAFGAFALGLGQVRIGTFLGLFGTFILLKQIIPALGDMFESFGGIPMDAFEAMTNVIKDAFIRGLIALGVVVTALGLFGYRIQAAGKGLKTVGITAVVIIAAIVAIAALIKRLRDNMSITGDDISRVTWGFVAAMASFTVIIFALAEFRNLAKDEKPGAYTKIAAAVRSIGFTALAIVGGVVLIAKAVRELDGGGIAAAIITIGVVIGMILVLAHTISKLNNVGDVKGIGSAVASIMWAITVITTEIMLLTMLDNPEGLFYTCASIALAFAGLYLIFESLANLSNTIPDAKKWGNIIAIIAAMAGSIITIGVLAVALDKLAKYDWANILSAGGAMALAFGGIAVMFKAMGDFATKDIGAILVAFVEAMALVVIIPALADALSQLAQYDWQSILASGASFMLALLSVMGAIALIGELTTSGVGTIGIVAGLLAIGAAMFILTQTMRSISNSMLNMRNALVETLTIIKSMDPIDAIGMAQRSYVAGQNVVLYYIRGIMNQLPNLQIVADAMRKSGAYTSAGFVLGLTGNLQDVYKSMMGVGRVGLKGFDDAMGIRSPAREMIQRAWYTVKGFVQGIFKNKGMVEDSMSSLAKLATDAFNGNLDINSMVEGFTEKFKLTSFSDSFADFKEEFLNIGGSISEQINESFNIDTPGLEEKVKSTFETLYDTISGQLDMFKEFDFTADLSTDQLLKNMSDNLLGVTEWSNDMAMLAARGVSQPLLEKLGSLGPQGFKYVKAFVNMTDEELQEASSMWGMSLKLPSYAAEEVEASYKFAGEMAAKGYSNALDKYASMLDAYSIGELTMEQIQDALRDYTPKVINTLKDGIGGIPPAVTPPAEDAGDDIGGALGESMHNRISDECNTIKGDLKAFAQEVNNIFAGYGRDQYFYDYFNLSMSKGTFWQKTKFESVFDELDKNVMTHNYLLTTANGKALKEAYTLYSQYGVAALEGLENGIINDLPSFIRVMGQFADMLPQTVKDKLEIHSPSKVLYKLGQWATKGFVNAIIDGTPEVTNITEDMTDSLIDTMSGFSEEVNKYLNSEGDLNPVISPVLDLTNVQNGASTLDSLFSADKAIRATSVYDDNARMAAEIAAANRTDQLETVINACVNKVIEAMVANQPVVETNIYNDADPFGIFKAVRSETKKFTRANGYNPLI